MLLDEVATCSWSLVLSRCSSAMAEADLDVAESATHSSAKNYIIKAKMQRKIQLKDCGGLHRAVNQ
jgi:hypothetical protein